MNYEGLLDEAYDLNLFVKETNLLANKGRIKGNRIAIRKDIPTLKEKSCILAEELGHFYTNHGNIMNQNITSNRKQEYKARLWSYNKQVGLIGIINSFNAGCQSLYEMAEFLEVTEEFLHETLKCFKSKYGEYTKIDNYIITFEPQLSVFKLI